MEIATDNKILFVLNFIVNVNNSLNKIILSSHKVKFCSMPFENIMRNRSNPFLRSQILSLYFYSIFYSRARKVWLYILWLVSIDIILLSIFILEIFILKVHVVIAFSTLWHVGNCCFIIILAIWHVLLLGFILYKIILGLSL